MAPFLAALRRRLPALAAVFVAGALVAGVVAGLRRPVYRATATLLVAEPRFGPPGAGVDFNLTPVRSYTALLGSQALADACAATAGSDFAALSSALRARMPENTRLLEVSSAGPDPEALARFLNCVALKAVVENRRQNEALAANVAATVDASLADARKETEALEGQMVAARKRNVVEVKRGELRSALGDLEMASDDERRALQAVAEAAARRKRLLAASGQGENETRAWAEKEALEAGASEEAARAAAAEAGRRQRQSRLLAAGLERDVAECENELTAINRRREGAIAAESELIKRKHLFPVESESKSFELVPVAPASPPRSPSTPRPILVGLLGGAAAAAFFALATYSRPT